MKRNLRYIHSILAALAVSAVNAAAQAIPANEKAFVDNSGGMSWTLIVLMVAIALGAAFFFWKKSRNGDDKPQYNYGSRYSDYYRNESYELDGVDADKELEWLRKAKKTTVTPSKLTFEAKKSRPGLPKPEMPKTVMSEDGSIDTKLFQEKMRRLQYAQLPINSFSSLSASRSYEPLPLSDDPSVVNAIEQANEEFEDDENVRDLALRVLSAFRTRNSIDALSQIALYDLSSNLRSKAVATLTDFDHESVFEPILLACADPTREVRAAAARGLFRLNFDRADAWKRIIETNDEFRMSHAAKAAIEAGIVVKSFDRLVHEDMKVAYEAFALVSLLIKAGETKEIFEALRTHRDERVKFALLHVLRVQKDERAHAKLIEFQLEGSFQTDMADRVRDAVAAFEPVLT